MVSQEVQIKSYGSGYDTPTIEENTSASFDTTNNTIKPSNALSQVLQAAVTIDPLTGTLFHDKIYVHGSGSNDGEYTIVSATTQNGIEVFPNLSDSGTLDNLFLMVSPRSPTVLLDTSKPGGGAQLKAHVASPDVTVRDTRSLFLRATARGDFIDRSVRVLADAKDQAPAPDGTPGKIIRVEYYANGRLLLPFDSETDTPGLPSPPGDPSFYAVSSAVEANANGDVIPLGASATYAVPTDNWLTDLNWLPETTDEGIHEIFALAYDDDHNVTATRPVELRIINKQAREPRIVNKYFQNQDGEFLRFSHGSTISMGLEVESYDNTYITSVEFFLKESC